MFVCGVPKDSSEFARVLKVNRACSGDSLCPPRWRTRCSIFARKIYAAVVGPDDSVAAYFGASTRSRKSGADGVVAGDVTEPDS